MKLKTIGTVLCLVGVLAGISGCGDAQEADTEKLVICTDEIHKDTVETLAEDWRNMVDGAEVEIISIPQDESLAQTKITELRTELMSGGGPDVFLVGCNIDTDDGEAPMLFPNPEKAMYSGLFLPLDDYMENARYMDPEHWNQKIMSAGKTPEGQLTLPIAYTYCAYAFDTEALENPSSVPGSWDELLQCQEPAIRNNVPYGACLWLSQTFARLADYENETLMFSEEELEKRVEDALAWQMGSQVTEEQSPVTAYAQVGDTFWSQVSEMAGNPETILPVPNDENGVTAYVTLYAAVNRNTEHPEQAFDLLDFMFSDQVMTGVGFASEDSDTNYGHSNNFSFATGVLTNTEAARQALRVPAAQALYEDTETRITHVRYYSQLDNTISQMYSECFLEEAGASSGENGKKEIIAQAYQTMCMQLAE